jgi:hypothetical protein
MGKNFDDADEFEDLLDENRDLIIDEELGKKIAHKIAFRLASLDDPIFKAADLVTRKIHDMALYYVWVVHEDGYGIGSAQITKEFAKKIGFSEPKLFQLALENTKRMFPMTVRLISEVIEEAFSDLCEETPEGPLDMYVLSNSRDFYGATTIMYDDVLQSLCDQLDSNLYLLPSSVHEFLAIPIREEFNEEDLKNLVIYVNETVLSEGEKLTDSVYAYNKESHELTKCA